MLNINRKYNHKINFTHNTKLNKYILLYLLK